MSTLLAWIAGALAVLFWTTIVALMVAGWMDR